MTYSNSSVPVVLAMLLSPAAGAADLAGPSLEDLLATEVVGASKNRQLIREAPANVTVITAEEIRRYGYRTVSDALVRVPGLAVAHTPYGSSLALRGSTANQPTDWGARVLLMVDGHRVNDGIYDQALFGYDSLVDIEAVERIEFIKGPGSALYGGNALYGVVNVITRRGRAAEGAEFWSQATPGAAAFGTTLGGREDGGVEWRLSAARRANPSTASRSAGLPMGNLGTYGEILDYADHNEQASLTVDAGPYRLVALASRWQPERSRLRQTDFDKETYPDQTDGRNSQYLLGVSGRWLPGDKTALSAQFSVGQSERHFIQDWEEPGHVHKVLDWQTASRWSGSEVRLCTETFERQRLSVGVEWRRDWWRDYRDRYWIDGAELAPLASRSSRDSVGVYLQDEIALAERWALTVGGRLDRVTGFGSEFSPRFALVWAPSAATTLKWIHAEAFRPPNSYEYDPTMSEGGQLLPQVKPAVERVRSNEWVLEFRQGNFAGSAALFANRNQGMIAYLGGSKAVNQPAVSTRGVELSGSWRGLSGLGGYANLAGQKSRDAQGRQPADTAEWLASAGVDAQTGDGRYRGAIEWQAVGRRFMAGKVQQVPGYGVANLKLAAQPWQKGLDLSVQVLNLAGREYRVLAQNNAPLAPGRTVWLGVRYTP